MEINQSMLYHIMQFGYLLNNIKNEHVSIIRYIYVMHYKIYILYLLNVMVTPMFIIVIKSFTKDKLIFLICCLLLNN